MGSRKGCPEVGFAGCRSDLAPFGFPPTSGESEPLPHMCGPSAAGTAPLGRCYPVPRTLQLGSLLLLRDLQVGSPSRSHPRRCRSHPGLGLPQQMLSQHGVGRQSPESPFRCASRHQGASCPGVYPLSTIPRARADAGQNLRLCRVLPWKLSGKPVWARV